MLLGKSLAVFIERSPVSVMVSATLERVFEPAVLDRVFRGACRPGLRQGIGFLPVRANHVRRGVQGIAVRGSVLPSPPGRNSGDPASCLRQVEAAGIASPRGVGALLGRGTESLREGDAVAGPAAAASLPRTSPGWKSPDWHRASYFRVAPVSLRRLAGAGAGVLRSAVWFDHRRGSLRRRPCPGALVVEGGVGVHLRARLHLGGPQLLHQRVFVRYSSPAGLFYHPAARIHALLRIEGKTPFGGPG